MRLVKSICLSDFAGKPGTASQVLCNSWTQRLPCRCSRREVRSAQTSEEQRERERGLRVVRICSSSVFLQCLKSGCGPEWRTPGNTWMFVLSHLPSWTPHRLTSSCFGVYSTVFHPTPPSCALLPLVCGLCNCFIFPLWGARWAEGDWDFLGFSSYYAESAQAFLSRRNSFQSVHNALALIFLIRLSES